MRQTYGLFTYEWTHSYARFVSYEWVTYEKVESHTWRDVVSCEYVMSHMHSWVMSDTSLRHVTSLKDSSRAHAWATSRIWMRHVTHFKKSIHTHINKCTCSRCSACARVWLNCFSFLAISFSSVSSFSVNSCFAAAASACARDSSLSFVAHTYIYIYIYIYICIYHMWSNSYIICEVNHARHVE